MGTNWSALESVQDHINRAAMHVAGIQADFHTRWLSVSSLESPIEAIFFVWWSALGHARQIDDEYVELRQQFEVECSGRKYRLDFIMVPKHGLRERAAAVGIELPRFAIELDGHDFHERTKEQVMRRNERDRDLQADGWTVLHYSGTELYRDPDGCIQDAFGHAYKAFGWLVECRVAEAEMAAESAALATKPADTD